MKKDKISIIIPIYNVEKYLSKCLDSVINQTYKNIEIIVINDGSTDNSLSICKKYKEKDKRIKLINKENGGVSSARNRGLDVCTGNYVTFIDSDDYVDYDYIETLYNKLKKYNVDLVFSNAIDICNGIRRKSNYNIKKDIVLDRNNIYRELLKEKYITSVCWGNLYKSNLIKNIRFDYKMRISEDMKFLFEVISNSNNFLIISEKKYYYVIRSDSVSHSNFNIKWSDEINYCRELLDEYKNTVLMKYTIKRYVRIIVYCMYIFKMEKNEYRKLESLIKPYIFKYLFSNVTSFKEKIICLIVLLKGIYFNIGE